MMKFSVLSGFALALAGFAEGGAASPSLHYQTGRIPVLRGQATLDTGTSLRFLDAAGARQVIVDLWGNPPESAEDVQGLIVPVGLDPGTEQGWAIVLTESADGHVSDDDAASLNYVQLMKDMQAGTEENNSARKDAGYEPVHLIGWAETPHYDPAAHKIFWAKELAFGEGGAASDHTLNYAVRVLGRDNVMELNAVASMGQLPQVKRDMQAVLGQVTFNAGHRYEDYRAGTDRTAAYGVAGLLGVVAAKKVGLLAGGLLLLKKGWVLLLAALGGLGRFFKRREA
ncbi:DUF2167 domain-containing protein [Deinococcus navajonensis]|uniref:DUF2167 domain-containing protein n=1 Tax=Deinococcus navajonensis TaxID=309884 RepID=A0ABV8XL92_9DEIO